MKIYNRFTGKLIIEVQDVKTDLYRANLYRANLSGAYLYRANLSRADLSCANLPCANLSDADLYRANLSCANLYRANLSCANLYRANLYRANLSGANLSGANLWGCIGNMREIKTHQCGQYIVNYTKKVLWLGCQNHTLEQWLGFTDDKIIPMAIDALEYVRKWLPTIEKLIEMDPAE